jgi:hypothetical protein
VSIETCELAATIPRLRPAGGLPYTLLRNLLRLLALRPLCGTPRFDRNLTTTGCLPLSFPVPLRELEPEKSAVLSLPVPHCTSLSVEENDYESEGRRFESCRARHTNIVIAGKARRRGKGPEISGLRDPYPILSPSEPRCCCAGCGEPSGSVSEGTGFPVVCDRESGRMFHVRCLPGNLFLDAQWSCLERLGP